MKKYLQRTDLLLLLVVPLLFLLGLWGFRILRTVTPDEEFAALTWLDSLYHTLRGFIVEWDVPAGRKPWQLELFRWLAPVSILAAVVGLLKNVIRREWPLVQASWSRDHTLICGLGDRGVWLCRDQLRKGKSKAVGIESDPDADSLVELRKEGAISIHGNARDIDVLKSVNLRRAKRLVVVTRDDETNLAIAKEVAEQKGQKEAAPEIVAAVEGYEARSYFADKLWTSMRIRVIGFRHYASLRLAKEIAEKLADLHGPIPKHAPVLCVEASDALRIELLRALAMLVQISGDDPPVIHVCGANEADRTYFDDLFPASDMAATFQWHEDTAIRLIRAGAQDFDRIDAAIFALEPDTVSLHAAERFKMACRDENALVYACILDTDDLLKLAKPQQEVQGSTGDATSGVIVKSLYDIGGNNESGSLFDLYEEGAEFIASKYDEHEKKRNPVHAVVNFKDKLLSEQNSNRMAAMHADVKQKLWKKADSASDRDPLLLHLCKCEHMRWMGYHVMEGWQLGEKDKPRQIHDCLKPFDELKDSAKEYDLLPVFWSLPEYKEKNLKEFKVKGVNA